MEKLYTVKELAIKLNISIKGVYTRIYTNKIKAYSKVGRENVYKMNQLLENNAFIIELTETFYIYESKINNM